MKKYILLFLVIMIASNAIHSQARGVRIGYIDMEYILQNVPDYMEAKNQLEQKAQRWKQEIEVKQNEINNLKEALKTEQVLLTKELIQERNEEILFQQQELLDYQQRRFGPTGDLATQKAVLAQPVQDQVFSSVQDIAEAKKYDFIFDKSSDLTMLFTAKRYDISDQVVRAITRSSKRSQLTKKQLQAEEAKEALEDVEDVNPNVAARQKVLDDKKAAREQLIEDRKLANEEKKRLAAEKRQATLDARAGKTAAATTVIEESSETIKTTDGTETSKKVVEETTSTAKAAEDAAIARQKVIDDKAAVLAEKRKALEEKKQKVLADRAAAKKEKDEKAAAQKAATEAEKENKTN